MKIIKISSAYNWNKLGELHKNLGKGIPYIILASSGKRILITHGNKNGKIQFENEYVGLYDEILCCWKDTGEINWVGYKKLVIKNEDGINEEGIYLIQTPTSELNNFQDNNKIIQSIQSGIVE